MVQWNRVQARASGESSRNERGCGRGRGEGGVSIWCKLIVEPIFRASNLNVASIQLADGIVSDFHYFRDLHCCSHGPHCSYFFHCFHCISGDWIWFFFFRRHRTRSATQSFTDVWRDAIPRCFGRTNTTAVIGDIRSPPHVRRRQSARRTRTRPETARTTDDSLVSRGTTACSRQRECGSG